MGDISALGHQHRHGTITFQKALCSIIPLIHLFKLDLLGLFIYFTHFLPSSDSVLLVPMQFYSGIHGLGKLTKPEKSHPPHLCFLGAQWAAHMGEGS